MANFDRYAHDSWGVKEAVDEKSLHSASLAKNINNTIMQAIIKWSSSHFLLEFLYKQSKKSVYDYIIFVKLPIIYTVFTQKRHKSLFAIIFIANLSTISKYS
jgi:hypothetical protein